MISYGVNFAVLELDTTPFAGRIQGYLKEKSGMYTVPNLFVNGSSQGGCMDIKSMEHSGKFLPLIAPYVGPSKVPTPRVTSVGLFYFPETVNGNVVQGVGFFTSVISVLCVIFYKHFATKYVVFALCMDFFSRFLFGASVSPLGMLAMVVTSPFTPNFSAGAPKQFAASIGVFFTTVAAGLYLGGQDLGGAIVMAILAAASGLEGYLGFCLGCFIFGKAILLGLIPGSVYQPYLNLYMDKKWSYNFHHEKREFPKPEIKHVLLPGQTEASPIDLITKVRIETEYKIADVDMIRHTRVDFFAIPMTIAALAYIYKLTDSTSKGADFNTGFVYQVLGISSVILGGLITILYVLKMIMYPKKIIKEWYHPIVGQFFSTISITIVLYGLLLLPESVNGGSALIWIGSVLQMLFTVLKVSDLIYQYFSEEFINPSLIMTPVGNFIAAIGFATMDFQYHTPNMNGHINYLYLSRVWFGVASLFAIVLFTVTFKQSLNFNHVDERFRHTLWVWLAMFSVAGPAYFSVSNFDPEVGLGIVYQSLWAISLFFMIVLGNGWIRNFFSYTPDMVIWIEPFSLCAFALNTSQYKQLVIHQLFLVLSFITYIIATVSTIVCFLHTLNWALDMSLFTPRPKWGPVSLMKLTHEAFRFCLPKLTNFFTSLKPEYSNAVNRFVDELEILLIVYDEHRRHEDDVVFPVVRRYFPHLNPNMDHAHSEGIEAFAKFQSIIKSYRLKAVNEPIEAAQELLKALEVDLPNFIEHTLEHLRDEENTVVVALRKYVPLEIQRKLSESIFNITSPDNWRIVMPYVINNLPAPGWKLKYLKTFIWGNPARAHEIGLILYPTLDSVTWESLTQDIPEIIPRGLPRHVKIY